MIYLPTVSIIAYDNTDHPERTLKVIHHCKKFFQFSASILVSRLRPNGVQHDEGIFIVNEVGYGAAQRFEAVTLGKYVRSDHALYVSHDGCILNPEMWDHKWLNYDFVGAPWPSDIVIDNHRIGNNAFCLRSRKFNDLCSLCETIYRDNIPSDVFACQMMRPLFEHGHGIKYAPLEVAADFSWDVNIPEFPSGRPDAFGGHKKSFVMT